MYRQHSVKWVRTIPLTLIFAVCSLLLAQVDSRSAPSNGQPIRALLVTGGCCHDYPTQKNILPTGVSARAHVKWTVAHQGGKSKDAKIPLFQDPDWAKGYDVVVYNLCFARIGDKSWVRRIVQPHRNGTPAVFVHCAMHCFLDLDGPMWEKLVGVRTNSHKSKKPLLVKNKKRNHFITKPIGKDWTTPAGELYEISDVLEGTRTLATGQQVGTNDAHTSIWTRTYGPRDARVFGTTIGHHNQTMANETFLDVLTRGILWAAGETDDKLVQQADDEDRIRMNRMLAGMDDETKNLPENLALDADTEASSNDPDNYHFSRNAVDSNSNTRWAAEDKSAPQYLQINFERIQTLKSVRLKWQKPDVAYQYRIQVSTDGQSWNTVIDASDNDQAKSIHIHNFEPVDTRHLRVTYLGSETGRASIKVLGAYGVSLSTEESDFTSIIDTPDSFEHSIFARYPDVNYPACITTSAGGDLFVGVDPEGSLGHREGNGKILRVTDMDGDGKADDIRTFAKLDHPRGMVYDRGKMWVLHPPKLSLLHDRDLDGRAEERKTLVEGVSTRYLHERGWDHTVNGIRMGIDGWIYIAVGDFGLHDTEAIDGTTLNKRGGGILRIRPDGTEMEVHSWELRNIYDVAVDPFLNLYSRDNTNDGEGWNVRVSHYMQSARYGYPARYSDFAEEIFPPLGQYGGGSGAGALYLHDLRWPDRFNDYLLTADWGTYSVYSHRLEKKGPTYMPHQEQFVTIEQPTDLEIDGTGRLFISSWKNGKFKYRGENVGYIAMLTPESYVPNPPEDPEQMTSRELVRQLTAPSSEQRKLYQRALLDRDTGQKTTNELLALARDAQAERYARVAAVFTLKQMLGASANKKLLNLLDQSAIKRSVLKALTDRKGQLDNLPVDPFVDALDDSDPDVRAQALISIGRLNATQAAEQVLPLTRRSHGELPEEEPVHAQPDAGRVIPHLAVRTLVKIRARDACLNALGGPFTDGALEALSRMHDEGVVDGLIKRLKETDSTQLKKDITTELIRLYKKEAPFEGDWWSTTPNPDGPYAEPITWAASDRIEQVLHNLHDSASDEVQEHIQQELKHHAMNMDGLRSD